MTSEITSSYLERDCQDCQTRQFMGTELMLCLMDITQCTWAIPYKNELFFCKHPTASQFNKLGNAITHSFETQISSTRIQE